MFKRVIYILSAALVISSCTTPEPIFPSLWELDQDHSSQYSENWVSGNHELKATVFGEASLCAVSKSGETLKYTFKEDNGRIGASLKEGDSWVFTYPTSKIAKGTYVELDFTMVSHPASPKYFIVEILDGNIWKANKEDLRPVPENPTLFYTLKCTGLGEGRTDQHTMCLQTFKLDKNVKGELKIRVRAVGPYTCFENCTEEDEDWSGFTEGFNIAAHMHGLGCETPKDTTKILCIGNSFTYVFGASWMLKEIAFSQGHYLDTKVSIKGGQSLGQHLNLDITIDAIGRGDYNYAFLQDQSTNCAKFGKDSTSNRSVLKNAQTISSNILKESPDCNLILERTWSYKNNNYGSFGSYEEFDKNSKVGADWISESIGATVSPIAEGFIIVRDERPDIDMYYTDNHHQSPYGAYLKACINYYIIYKDKLSDAAPDCSLDPEKAKYLREVAARVMGIK